MSSRETASRTASTDGRAEGAGVRGVVDRRRDHAAAPRLHHHPPVRLLLVRRPHHVDLALHVEQGAGQGQRAPPLARSRLGGQPGHALLLVVEGLGDGGVRLVRAGRRHRFVLEVDAGRRAEGLLQPAGADQRRGAPRAQDVEDLARDVDPRLGRDLLADQGHWEQRGEVVGPHGLPGGGMEGRLERGGQVGDDVEPGLGDPVAGEYPAVDRAHAVPSLSRRRASAGSGSVTRRSPTRAPS